MHSQDTLENASIVDQKIMSMLMFKVQIFDLSNASFNVK